MKRLLALLFVALGLGVWLGGCKVKNPGSAIGNQPPTTVLSVAPRDSATVNYFITLAWSGNDPDGTVAGFDVTVDSTSTVFTTSSDTTIAFYTPDTTKTLHSFLVQAVDNSGAVDSKHDATNSRHFYTINQPPQTVFGAGGIANGDLVGPDFRVVVSSIAPRPSSSQFSVALDDPTAWTVWTSDSIFAFAAPELLTDPLFPAGVFGISNAGLTAGQHIVYIRSQNGGGAVSNIAADTIQVGSGAGFQPTMDSTVTATYGSSALYPDGSAYYVQATGQVLAIGFAAHVLHKGEINAYRYRTGQITPGGIDWNGWSVWQTAVTLDTTDLPVGDFPYQFMARDLADQLSDTLTYTVHLVQQVFSDSVIIAADTRNLPGTFSVRQALVNNFYESLLDAGGLTHHRVVQAAIDDSIPDSTRHGKAYLSPYDVRNAGLVVWHMEDPNPGDPSLQAGRVRFLTDYLGKGGRIILSGWNLIAWFQDAPTDSIVFDPTSYAVTRLKVFSGWRQGNAFRAAGYKSANGFPQVLVDGSKLPSGAGGRLNNCWTFDPQGQDIVTGLMAASDSTTNARNGRPSSYIYNLSFRIAVFGIPLYFCHQSEVQTLFYNPADPAHSVLTIMVQGLQ